MGKREELTTDLGDKKARQIILRNIAASTDEGFGKGTFWRSASFVKEFGFADLMDILLYYLSLQPDLCLFAAKIETSDFLWQTVQKHWQKRAKELFPFINRSPWASGPGPMGGTAGPAESYSLRTGIFDKSLLAWLWWPEELEEESENNWPKYKKHIETMLFPRLRRRYNQKKLEAALAFAEEICETMRQAAAQKNNKQ